VTAHPRGSVLIRSDFTGASFGEEAIRVLQETAVFDKPFVKKSSMGGSRGQPCKQSAGALIRTTERMQTTALPRRV
jgi:hypothetical protein